MSAAANANMQTATRDLLIAWERALEQWRDQKSVQFGQNFVAPLPDLAAQSRQSMEQMESLLKKIKHDCE
jgi:hypothetical protein